MYSTFTVMRYSQMPECEHKEDVFKLMNSLVNILAIVKHFQNKIKDWLASQNLSTPTEEQVLEVVRKNYDLTLKLQESLDHYERYAERPKHTAFFTNIVRDVIVDARKNIYSSIKEVAQNAHQELVCSVVSSQSSSSVVSVTTTNTLATSPVVPVNPIPPTAFV